MKSAFGGAVALALCLGAFSNAALADPSACPAGAESNRAAITRFADLFYRQKLVREAFEAYVAADYIQHNPGIADGRQAAIDALVPLFGRPDHRFEVRHILVDGDMAAIHVQVYSPTPPGTQGAAVVDLYRLDCGRIFEHWDVIQLIPTKAANAHPSF